MYQSHWGLQEQPFRSGADPRFFYESPTHDEALARLHFLVEQQRRLGLLTGASGSGKTLLLEVLAGELGRRCSEVALVNVMGIDGHELLWSLAAQLGLDPNLQTEKFVLWRSICDRLREFRYQQREAVILLDDADQMTDDVRLTVLRLIHADPSPDAKVTFVLALASADAHKIGKQLIALSELRIDLEPWQREDTIAYLNASVAKAGRDTPIFDQSASARLHDLSHGVPRRIGQLAELALVAGAGLRLPNIDRETVESAYQELLASSTS